MQNILVHKKYLLLVFVIFLSFLIWGFIYYYGLKENIGNIIIDFNDINIKCVIIDIIIYSVLLTLSFLFIGVPLSIVYLGYESFILGFFINIILKVYSTKGIFILMLYLPLKLISIILLILFLYRLINISRNTLRYVVNKEEYIKNRIVINYKKSLYIMGINIILDLIIFIVFKMLANV